LNTTLCGEGSAAVEVALNGIDFESLNRNVTINTTERYVTLFILLGATTDYGWTFSHNLGRLQVSDDFGTSVESVYVEDVEVRSYIVLELRN
jgi:basic membrane lipoprotein Med (substrate-binding protein (PBP1-ABC) superfamily)